MATRFQLGKPNRLEKVLYAVTLAIYGAFTLANVSNHGDFYYLIYAVAIVFIVVSLNYLASSLVHFIPYVPREISTVYFCGLLIAIPGGSALVFPIIAAMLFSYWFWWLKKHNTLKGKKSAYFALTMAVSAFVYIASYPILGAIYRTQQQALNASYVVEEAPRYSIETFTYGSGDDKHRRAFSSDIRYKTKSVDATEILQGWEGISGWYRSFYWGFDLSQLPLNGRVWMPKGKGPFPLVLITHGDHAMQDYSDEGYGYLAKHLAGQGHIVVSVDLNYLNRSWSDLMLMYTLNAASEIHTRAVIMAEHAGLWNQWNQDQASPLYQQVNIQKITLIGHSRGGETVAQAPREIKRRVDNSIAVNSIIAIAPVDSIYWPEGKQNWLNDTNYLLLHGNLDGEMHYAGVGQYSRTQFSGAPGKSKVAVYIKGANHGLFNSTWGRCDSEFFTPLCSRLHLKDLIPEKRQQAFAVKTIDLFLKGSLSRKGNDDAFSRPLIEDWLDGVSHKVQYQNSDTQRLVDFQDETLEKTVLNQSVTHSKIKELWGGSRVHHIRWGDCGKSTKKPECLITYSVESKKSSAGIMIDIANATKKPLNFTVKVNFKGGKTQAYGLSEYEFLEPRYDRALKTFDYFIGDSSYEIAFDTYFFKFDKKSVVDSISIYFDQDPVGEIYVDNIGVEL